jgi:hypothetical protein
MLAQFHFGDAVVEFLSGLFYFCQLVFGLLFVADVDVGEVLAGCNESPK